jgi:hypothetical protein
VERGFRGEVNPARIRIPIVDPHPYAPCKE